MCIKKQILLVLVALLAVASSASGQLNGENLKGDSGLNSGTQAPPGTYLTNLSYFYGSNKIKLPSGNAVAIGGDGLNLFANVTVISRVTKKKFLGANYGVMLAIPALSTQLELPRLSTNDSSFGISDLYVVPLQLGWNKKKADYVASFGFFAPTGRYHSGADNNTGLGMWSYEISGGTTIYPDKKKSWNISTLAAYEMHGKKRGIDVKVGDILTLEGGVGKTFLKRAANLGAVYYAQWKVTADSGSDLSPLLQRFGVSNAKNKAFAFGPEFSLVVPKLEGQFNVRALKEFGNSTATQGYAVVASFTFFVDRPFKELNRKKPEPAPPTTQPSSGSTSLLGADNR